MYCAQKPGPHDTTLIDRNSLLKGDVLQVASFWSQLIEANKHHLYIIPSGRQPGIGTVRWVTSFC